MNPTVALILCLILVIVLLCIERIRNPEASNALWVPTSWLLLCGSKPLGVWFGSDAILASVGSEEAGSLYDRLVLSILIILALLIIYRRKIDWSGVLIDNFWLILLFLYLGYSILWSDFPLVSFKRWARLCGGIPIAMVVLSERSPVKALESAFRRCAYVLIPFSLVLIKYFPNLGVEYSPWAGTRMWTGVASQKNGLGVVCAISVFLVIWTFLRERRAKAFLKPRSQAFADGLVLAIALFLLLGNRGVYPATAVGFLIVGIVSLLLLRKMKNNVRHMATLSVLMVALGLFCLTFVDVLVPFVTSVFQRNETFTGRTEIWRAVLDVASRNPVLGVGYGGYWGLLDEITSRVGVKEAHSGYLGVYLEVGMVGIVLLSAFLLAHHRRALRELDHAYDLGLFGICLLIMTLIHNYTESNFLSTSSYSWNATLFVTIALSTRRSRTIGK